MNPANDTIETLQNHIDGLTKTQNDLERQITIVQQRQTDLSNEYDQINTRRVDIESQYDKNIDQLKKMKVQFKSVIDSIESYTQNLNTIKDEAVKITLKKNEFDVRLEDKFDRYVIVNVDYSKSSEGLIGIVAIDRLSRWNDMVYVSFEIRNSHIYVKSSELKEAGVVPEESTHTKINF